MSKIDLLAFCDTDDIRYFLRTPFSDGAYTCATDGKILVRVPRIDTINENPKISGKTGKIFKIIDDFSGEYVSLADYMLPDFDFSPRTEQLTCDECGGSGREHDCPDCECECEACDGTGKYEYTVVPKASVEVLGLNFGLRYIAKIWTLPALTVAVSGDSLVFKFDGGAGVLMKIEGKYEQHFGPLKARKEQ